ncbi:ABC transporter permease [Solirubrobacter sp. CPCC 204708]|uniref:Autoinducer 2 import system permease protein LsrD n=1 Tax=Solirubrobacter deserti TaxID=2282478 RepID=A0ABT4RJE4_9ACTN|nr:ABC transporter permease [Solirubrobacter deserti]MBE2317681.1 ABC transporter permease [Solirubrobacter deserti]MDA0138632.1 ABC transporter permease [Solirubrobacter deserti]
MSTENATVSGFGVASGGRGGRFLKALLSTGTIFVLLIALWVWIAIINPTFAEPGPFLAYLKRSAPLVILAAGAYFVLISGNFDLSVGSLVTVMVVFAAKMIDGEDSRMWPIIALMLLIGVFVGFVNGFISTVLRVPSFITTLGTLLILNGAVFLWTGGAPTGALSENFRSIGRQGIDGIPWIEQLPWSVIIMVVIGVGSVLLMRADFGRQLLATGDNERAARLSGVRVDRVRILAFVLSGVLAAVAGILLAGFGGVSAQAGQGLEFDAITACVLGGVVLGGGRGSVVAAMAGALTLEALFTWLNLQGVSGALEDTVQGVIIIAAVGFAAYRLRGAR